MQQYKSTNFSQLLKNCCCLLAFLLLNNLIAHAGLENIGNDVDSTPIDGGLSLLVMAGIGYGAKRLKKNESSRANK